jgi:hypothetical protein
MKLLFLFIFSIASHSYAADICNFQETWEFREALKEEGNRPVLISKNHSKFTTVEKRLVHKWLSSQPDRRNTTLEQSMEEFSDRHSGKVGPDAGEIIYFNIDGKKYVLVHYWPGENEYGAFYSVNKNNSYKQIANITDSFIECLNK